MAPRRPDLRVVGRRHPAFLAALRAFEPNVVVAAAGEFGEHDALGRRGNRLRQCGAGRVAVGRVFAESFEHDLREPLGHALSPVSQRRRRLGRVQYQDLVLVSSSNGRRPQSSS